MFFTILEFPYILLSIRGVSYCSLTIWNSILNFTFIFRVSAFFTNSLPNIIRVFSPPIKRITLMLISNHRRRKKKEGEDDE